MGASAFREHARALAKEGTDLGSAESFVSTVLSNRALAGSVASSLRKVEALGGPQSCPERPDSLQTVEFSREKRLNGLRAASRFYVPRLSPIG